MDPLQKKAARKVRLENVEAGKDALDKAVSLSPSTAPSPVSKEWLKWVESYRQRLEKWLLDEKFYAKSWNKLAVAICRASPSEAQSVSGQSLQNWVKGEGLPLGSDRVMLLAAYRKTTPEHLTPPRSKETGIPRITSESSCFIAPAFKANAYQVLQSLRRLTPNVLRLGD